MCYVSCKMKRKIKLIIFDLDGTLVNAYKAVSRSLNHALEETGLKHIDDYTVMRSVGWGDSKLIRSLVPEHLFKKALRLYRAHHKKALKQGVHFLPFARQVLLKLHKDGYKIAIASNRPTRFTKIILASLNIRRYFHYVLCADKASRPKPHPDILLAILKRFDARPSEALYVGDMTIDAVSGRRARVRTAVVLTGSSTKMEIKAEKPYVIIRGLRELSGVLAGLQA